MDGFDPFAALRAERERERALAAERGFPGRTAFRHAFVPVLLLGTLAPWFLPARSVKLGSTGSLLWAVAFIWIAEQLYPAVRAWNPRPFADGLKGLAPLLRDLFYLVVVTQLTAFLVGLADGPLHRVVSVLRGGHGAFWPTRAPFAVRAALAFLVVELASYGYHRAAHRFGLLWQFHSTHHACTELRGLKAVQTHPLDNLAFYAVRTLPLAWLGASAADVTAALYLGGVLGLLAHANVEVSERGWGLFFNLPSVHCVHHSCVLEESRANFGCHTVLFDRLFGTYRKKPATMPKLGIRDGASRTLWQELVSPFHRRM